MSKGFTPEGQQALGALVRRYRHTNEVHGRVVTWMRTNNRVVPIPYPVSQEQFAHWVTATSGILVTESAIGRLERGEGRSGPPLNLLIALCRIQVLRIDGEVCDLNRVVGVLCGEEKTQKFKQNF